MSDSIHPWEGLEDGRLEYLTGRPLNWPHYTTLTIEVVLSISYSREVTFSEVEEYEDDDEFYPALPETTRTETHTASMTASWEWTRQTPGDEVFGATTGEDIPANKFRMYLDVGGPAFGADFSKAWNFTESGPSGTATGGTCSMTSWERSTAHDATYGDFTSSTSTGTIEAVWDPDEFGVLETFLGDWISGFNQSGGSTGVSFTADGPGLPTTPPLNYEDLQETNTSPPGGTPLVVTSTASETTPLGDPSIWHGTASTTITITLST
jgi:hypothetical protein